MAWQENAFVKWGVRVVGLVGAGLGFALQEPVALAVFGVYLVFEFWLMDERMSASVAQVIKGVTETSSDVIQNVEKASSMTITEVRGASRDMQQITESVAKIKEQVSDLVFYEYLPSAAMIWSRAKFFLAGAQPNDEIRSTASNPNDPEFESAILRKVIENNLVYKRLLCYSSPESNAQDHEFPPVEVIQGASVEEVLKSYLNWYAGFYAKCEKITAGDRADYMDNVGMHVWFEALSKVVRRTGAHFEVRSHGATLPSDYLIVNPFQDHSWKAVVGFPRLQGEGMRSGFSITHSPLARDLGLNWLRLWEQARTKR